MIMRGGQQLLLPASPTFIWASLLTALLLDMLPFSRNPWMPDFMALVLVFWNVHQPLRIGIALALAIYGVFDRLLKLNLPASGVEYLIFGG